RNQHHKAGTRGHDDANVLRMSGLPCHGWRHDTRAAAVFHLKPPFFASADFRRDYSEVVGWTAFPGECSCALEDGGAQIGCRKMRVVLNCLEKPRFTELFVVGVARLKYAIAVEEDQIAVRHMKTLLKRRYIRHDSGRRQQGFQTRNRRSIAEQNRRAVSRIGP